MSKGMVFSTRYLIMWTLYGMSPQDSKPYGDAFSFKLDLH